MIQINPIEEAPPTFKLYLSSLLPSLLLHFHFANYNFECNLKSKQRAMKTNSPPSLPAIFRAPLRVAVSFLLLFSLGFIFGFLSSSSSTFLPQFHVQTQFQYQPDNKIPVSTSPPPPLPAHDLGFPSTTPPSSSSSSPLPPFHVQSQPKNKTPVSASRPPPHDLLRFRTKCGNAVAQPEILRTVLNRLYNGSSPYAGFPPPAIAPHLYPPARLPRGWGSTKPVFRDLIKSVRPHTIIELGTFLGASALHMASITRNLSLPSLILCIDDFRGWPGFHELFARDVPPPHHANSLLLPQFMLAVAAAGESDRVIPLPFSTASALAALCDWGVYADLIEVDAGHDFHSAWTDINMAYAVLRPGGVLFGHDYYLAADNHGVHRAVTLFAKVKGLRIRPHGQHWILSPKPFDH